ncbi:BT_3928 family protein [Winogradskyella wandonensis]|nr:BT_3928 family protein [Winogradskyella wandonensis]
MKYIVQISRVFVGVLFIISGFIKLNDPLGFSYKLQEYFSSDVLNIPFLEPYSLGISVFVVVLEVVLGVFLLIGYKKKFTIWMLLGMIVFFTFLTFYSAYFDKVKDCGCFGDALKLTPWESFTKDVVLLVLILILFFGQNYIKPLFKTLPNTVIALLSFVVSLWFAYHVLMHLPAIDFRAYKIGNNLQDEMAIPDDAPKPIIEYTWTFKVNGEEKEFVTSGSYPNVDGEYIGVETKEIDPGFTPAIQDFTIESSEEDLTTYFLEKDNLVIVAMYNVYNAEEEGLLKLKGFTDEAIKKGYTVIGLSASGEDAKQQLKSKYNLNFDIYLCDEKVVKTIVRANPGIVVLNKGTVTNKAHWNDIEDIELESLPNATPNLDLDLKRQLDSIMVLDQKYRANMTSDNWKLQLEIDSSNTAFVESIFKKHGYPGKSIVGDKTSRVAWFVIQHSNKIETYFPLIKEAGEKGELSMTNVAMMEDRYLTEQGLPQKYGTQGATYFMGTPQELSFFWPIEDFENVNKRRKEAGFSETVEAYSKSLFGEDFVIKNYTYQDLKKLGIPVN